MTALAGPQSLSAGRGRRVSGDVLAALRFGRSGGCEAGCELCKYRWLCRGGTFGGRAEEEQHDEEKENRE